MRYASYLFHLVVCLPTTHKRMTRLLAYDKLIQDLARHPALWGIVMADAIWPVEDYLRLRPERLDQILAFVQTGRLDIGAWYVPPGNWHPELLIRNLQLGTATLALMGTTPSTVRINKSPQLPQILWGFDMRIGIANAHGHSFGADGSHLALVKAHASDDVLQNREAVVNNAYERHILVEWAGAAEAALDELERLRRSLPVDDVFFSNWNSVAKAAQAHMPPPPQSITPPTYKTPPLPRVADSIVNKLEPAAAFSTERPMMDNIEGVLQALWRDFLQAYAYEQDTRQLEQDIDELLTLLPNAPVKLIQANDERYEITACKPHPRHGIIVRGYNPTPDSYPIILQLWRPFTTCDVLHCSEYRTGAKLPIIDKKQIHFRANPYRITTLWLHDA